MNSVEHKPSGNGQVPKTSNLNRDRKFSSIGDTESKQKYGDDEKKKNSKKFPAKNEQNGFQTPNKNKKTPICKYLSNEYFVKSMEICLTIVY